MIEMMKSKRAKVLFLMLLCSMLLAGYYLHANLIFNVDNAWLLLATKRFLAGGTYTHDFFDVDTPIIFYLYTPAVLLARYFAQIPVFNFYVMVLIACSLFLSYILFMQLTAERERRDVYLYLTLLASLFIFIPGQNLGQRDDLLLIFLFPFIVLTSLRVAQKPVSHLLAALVGFFAGLGVGIKPFFMIPWLLLVGFDFLKEKKLKVFFYPENIAIGLLQIIFYLSIYFLTPDYITQVLPFAFKYKYIGLGISWPLLFNYIYFLYPVFFILPVILLFYPFDSAFINTLLVGIMGFGLTYVLQRSGFLYHVLPLFSMTFFGMIVILYGYYLPPRKKQVKYIPLLALLILFSAIFLTCTGYWNIVYYYILHINHFIVYFVSVFIGTLFLYHYRKNTLSFQLYIHLFLLALVGFLAMGVPRLFFSTITNFYLDFTCIVWLLVTACWLVLPRHDRPVIFSFSLFNAVLFAVPAFLILQNDVGEREAQKNYLSYVAFLNEHQLKNSFYIFSTNLRFSFPGDLLQPNTPVSSQGFLWMLPGLVKQSQNHANRALQKTIHHDWDVYRQMIDRDLVEHQPSVIGIDTSAIKANLIQAYTMAGMPIYVPIFINYLTLMSKDITFQNIFSHYQYVATFNWPDHPDFRIAFYKRVGG